MAAPRAARSPLFAAPLLLVALLTLTGCQVFGIDLPLWPRPAATAMPSPDLQVLTWVHGDAEAAWLQRHAQAFAAEHDGVQVTIALADDYQAQLERALAAPRPPDVFVADAYRLPQLASQGRLAPVPSGLVATADLHPQLVDGFSVDGQLACVPRDASTLALVYNQAAFQAAGIAPPTAAWTWQELRAAAEAISALPSVHFSSYGLTLPVDITRWLPFVLQAGGQLLDRQSGRVTLSSQAAADAFGYVESLYADGLAVEPSILASAWGGEALGNGRAGMAVEGNWVIPYLADRYPELRYGVSVLPSGPAGRGTLLFGTCYAVSAESEHPELAFALVQRLAGPEAQAEAIAFNPAIPARADLAARWAAAYPGQVAFLDSLAYAQVWQAPAGMEGVIDIAARELRGLRDGDLTVEEALADIEAGGNELLER